VEDLKTETQQTKISDAITNILKNMRNV
jgi:hypothetical protein